MTPLAWVLVFWMGADINVRAGGPAVVYFPTQDACVAAKQRLTEIKGRYWPSDWHDSVCIRLEDGVFIGAERDE